MPAIMSFVIEENGCNRVVFAPQEIPLAEPSPWRTQIGSGQKRIIAEPYQYQSVLLAWPVAHENTCWIRAPVCHHGNVTTLGSPRLGASYPSQPQLPHGFSHGKVFLMDHCLLVDFFLRSAVIETIMALLLSLFGVFAFDAV